MSRRVSMRKLALCTAAVFALYMGAAVAQSGMGSSSTGAQGTQGSSPNSGVQTSQPAPTETPGMSQGTNTDQNGSSNTGDHNKGEKRLKGCVESQGSQYVLETKKGAVALTGQDVSAHVGHEVSLKGTWENSGNTASSASATSPGSG